MAKHFVRVTSFSQIIRVLTRISKSSGLQTNRYSRMCVEVLELHLLFYEVSFSWNLFSGFLAAFGETHLSLSFVHHVDQIVGQDKIPLCWYCWILSFSAPGSGQTARGEKLNHCWRSSTGQKLTWLASIFFFNNWLVGLRDSLPFCSLSPRAFNWKGLKRIRVPLRRVAEYADN